MLERVRLALAEGRRLFSLRNEHAPCTCGHAFAQHWAQMPGGKEPCHEQNTFIGICLCKDYVPSLR